MALSASQGRYPIREFKIFVHAVRKYVAHTQKDPLMHRQVVNVINGFTDELKASDRKFPCEVLLEAGRLECLMFAGYDPYFKGNEPPGL